MSCTTVWYSTVADVFCLNPVQYNVCTRLFSAVQYNTVQYSIQYYDSHSEYYRTEYSVGVADCELYDCPNVIYTIIMCSAVAIQYVYCYLAYVCCYLACVYRYLAYPVLNICLCVMNVTQISMLLWMEICVFLYIRRRES